MPKQTVAARRRRLLQTGGDTTTFLVEHQGVSLTSGTVISWAGPLRTVPSPTQSPNSSSTRANAAPFEFPLWAGVLIGVVCALVLSVVAYLLLCRQARRPSIHYSKRHFP